MRMPEVITVLALNQLKKGKHTFDDEGLLIYLEESAFKPSVTMTAEQADAFIKANPEVNITTKPPEKRQSPLRENGEFYVLEIATHTYRIATKENLKDALWMLLKPTD